MKPFKLIDGSQTNKSHGRYANDNRHANNAKIGWNKDNKKTVLWATYHNRVVMELLYKLLSS